MAWSDSLFTAHDLHKLSFLANCCGASYQGGRNGLQAFVGSTVQQLQTGGPPNAYSFFKDGEQLVLIDGTTSGLQLIDQAFGWRDPVVFGTTGLVNRYHVDAAARIFLGAPASPALIFGHSMGGAIACLISRAYAVLGRPARCVTFAAPRPVNAPAATGLAWPAQRHYRLLLDPVPLIPVDTGLPPVWRLPGECFSLASPGVLPVADQTSNEWELSVIVSTYQDFYHSVSSYVSATTSGVMPTYTKTIIPGGKMIVRCQVVGSLHGQWCNNQIDYRVADETDLETVTDEWRRVWTQQVVAKVSNQYTAWQYETQRLGGAYLRVAGDATAGSRLVFVERHQLPASDEGGQNEQAFPSHDALGIIKACAAWLTPAGAAITDVVSPPKGGALGIGGILESSTDKDALGNNALIVADKVAWQNVANNLRTPDTVANIAMEMVVVTNTRQGAALMAGTPAAASYNYALVTSMIVNPYVTTRVSRKQKRNVFS